VVATAAIADAVAPASLLQALGLDRAAAEFATTPAWFVVAVIGLTILVVTLSYFPVRNMASPDQAMNASFDPFHLVNTYGAFGTVGRTRYEVIVQGTTGEPDDDGAWREYEFKGKPGDPRRLPPQVAPYHLRLDWLIWFLPLSPMYGQGWFIPFLGRLLEGDPAILRLLRHNPFPDRRPRYVRAQLYHYRFSTWRELRETRAWWVRTPAGELVRPIRLAEPSDAPPSPAPGDSSPPPDAPPGHG
jgi:hypothetical protein